MSAHVQKIHVDLLPVTDRRKCLLQERGELALIEDGCERKPGSSGRKRFLKAVILLAASMALWTAGCGGKAPRAKAPEPPRRELARMGFSIQVGAFSNLQNAARLVENLERRGINAYYFRHSSGLFKVRFGDFPTAEEARARAEFLVGQGVIDVFHLVRPEDYPAARALGAPALRDEIVNTAQSFLGIKYQWGGKSPGEGFDCSGLAMAVYQLNGLNLPRTSSEQFLTGNPIAQSDLDKGDLVFFAIKGGSKVSHVGLYAGEGRFIHAPGMGKKIRSDLLTSTYFSSRYIGGRTFL